MSEPQKYLTPGEMYKHTQKLEDKLRNEIGGVEDKVEKVQSEVSNLSTLVAVFGERLGNIDENTRKMSEAMTAQASEKKKFKGLKAVEMTKGVWAVVALIVGAILANGAVLSFFGDFFSRIFFGE
ncbi:hypothetical protein ACI2JA_04215 [Alkalihalobacillus sp. NPDC078783]